MESLQQKTLVGMCADNLKLKQRVFPGPEISEVDYS